MSFWDLRFHKIILGVKVKQILLLTVLCLALYNPGTIYGQHITTTAYTEKAVLGQQMGGRVGFESSKLNEFGIFYQKNISNISALSLYGYEFLGGYVSPKMLGNEEISLAPYIRAGVSDREFIVVVPGLEVEALLKGSFYLHFSASLRANEAAFSLGLMNKIKRR